MARPTIPASLATDATFLSGPDVGQPTRATMSAGERAQGVLADARLAAAKFNGLVGNQGDWITWEDELLANRGMQDWSTSDLPISGSQVMGLLAPLNLGFQTGGVVALGYDPADTNDVRFCRSYGSGYFEGSVFDPLRTEGPICCSGSVAGAFMWSENNAASIVERTALGTAQTVTATVGQSVALHYAEFATKYLTADVGGDFYHGTTLGTLAVAGKPAGLTAIGTANQLGAPGGQFADDGVGNIVFVASCVVSGVTAVRIFRSADNGATWTVARTYGGAITSASVLWHATTSQFIVLDSTGGVSYSLTGATWPSTNVISALSVANGSSARYGTFACAGHVIAKVYDPLLFGAGFLGGIAYSLDAGVTWRYQNVVPPAGGFSLLSLIGVGGHFYASDGARVYRSGLLSYPAVDV